MSDARCSVLAVLLVGSCSGPDQEEPEPSCEGASWEAAADPFLTTWCTPCHASSVPEASRRGAPLGVDFDTWEGAHSYADAIAARVASEEAPMPPGGGVPASEREAIALWAQCGAVGPVSVVPPCAVRVERPGDATEAGEPCTEGANAVTGSVRVGSDNPGALDCLCEIDGDLLIEGTVTQLALPNLVRVGGQVVLQTASLRSLLLPSLQRAGDVRLLEPALDTLDLSRLAVVDGLFVANGGRMPPLFAPVRLQSTGSHLGLSAVHGIELVDLPRLEEVGGNLVIEANPDLDAITHTSDLEVVRGALRIIDNPSLGLIEDFGFLVNVYGDVELGGGQTTELDALWVLRRVGGDLVLRDAPALVQISAFHDLRSVAGTLMVRGIAATEVEGFENLEELGGLAIVENPALASLPGLSQLSEVGGDVIVSRNAALLDLGQPAIQVIHGDLQLEDDVSLSSLLGLSQLSSVEGDLVLRNAPALPAAQVELLLENVTVGGTVLVEP